MSAKTYYMIAVYALVIIVALLSMLIFLPLTITDLFEGFFITPFTNSAMRETFFFIFAIFVCTSLAALIPFRSGDYNIGGEGQLLVGALTGAFASGVLHMGAIAILFLSAVGGLVWALISAILEVKLKMDIVVTTLLTNFIAIRIVDYFISYPPLEDPTTELEISVLLPARIPVYCAVGISVALLFFSYFLIVKSRWGYETRLQGGNPSAAKLAGVNSQKLTLGNMCIGGAIAGLGGGMLITGVIVALNPDSGFLLGYIGLLGAFMAKLKPHFVVLSSFLIALFWIGGRALHVVGGISMSISLFLIAALIIATLLTEIIGRVL